MPQVSVELGERSYVIDIAPGLLHSGVAEVAPHTESWWSRTIKLGHFI